jgi:hypothetical protein
MLAGMPPNRREFLQWIGAGAAVMVLPFGCAAGGFFNDDERRTLAALSNAVLPPDDLPGGAALGTVEYVETLLTAFEQKVPPIFLGGPYSGRQPFAADDGTPSATFPPNSFTQIVPLDRVAEQAWRTRLYGADGQSGLRATVKQAIAQARAAAGKPLDQLDPAALPDLFAGLDEDFRDALIKLTSEAAFGAPEYGGNPGGAGWAMVHYEGDPMPLGYSLFDLGANTYRERPDAPVTTADAGGDPEPLDDDSRNYLRKLINALGGKEFP